MPAVILGLKFELKNHRKHRERISSVAQLSLACSDLEIYLNKDSLKEPDRKQFGPSRSKNDLIFNSTPALHKFHLNFVTSCGVVQKNVIK